MLLRPRRRREQQESFRQRRRHRAPFRRRGCFFQRQPPLSAEGLGVGGERRLGLVSGERRGERQSCCGGGGGRPSHCGSSGSFCGGGGGGIGGAAPCPPGPRRREAPARRERREEREHQQRRQRQQERRGRQQRLRAACCAQERERLEVRLMFEKKRCSFSQACNCNRKKRSFSSFFSFQVRRLKDAGRIKWCGKKGEGGRGWQKVVVVKAAKRSREMGKKTRKNQKGRAKRGARKSQTTHPAAAPFFSFLFRENENGGGGGGLDGCSFGKRKGEGRRREQRGSSEGGKKVKQCGKLFVLNAVSVSFVHLIRK